jgi:hypothetical protein
MIPMTHANGPRDFAPERYRDYLYLLARLNLPRRLRSVLGASDMAHDTILKELKAADIAPVPGGPQDAAAAASARLSGRLMDIDSELPRLQERARARASKYPNWLLDEIEALKAERERVSEDLARLQHEAPSNPAVDLGEAQSLIDLLAKADDGRREELRRRLKARIRALVSEVWVLFHVGKRGKAPRHAHVQLFLRAGGVRNVLVCHPRPVPGVGPLPPGTDLRHYPSGAKAATEGTPVSRETSSAASSQAPPSRKRRAREKS